MKKHFILFILVVFLFASCSTTEEVVEDVPETVVVEQPEVIAAEIPQTMSEDAAEEEPEILVQEVLPTEEAAVQELEEPVVHEALTARDLVDQISGTILLPDSPQDMIKDIPAMEVVPEPFVETERIEEEAASAIDENIEALPIVEQSMPHIEAQDVLEEKLDFNYVRAIAAVISIILLFTVASIIRNRFFQPLAKSISAVLAILFAAIPMLIGTIITGWSSIYLLFLLLLSCYFVFRSKASSIHYR